MKIIVTSANSFKDNILLSKLFVRGYESVAFELNWFGNDYLASPSFDTGFMKDTLTIQRYVRVALNNHPKGIKKIIPGADLKPLNHN